MNTNLCYGQGHRDHMDAPVIPSLRRPQLGTSAVIPAATSEEDARSMSERLFGRVIAIGSQVCKGPCVDNDKLAFAFARQD